jgi:hypothetical protein
MTRMEVAAVTWAASWRVAGRVRAVPKGRVRPGSRSTTQGLQLDGSVEGVAVELDAAGR